MPDLEMTFRLGSGIFWSLAYILIILRGFRDRSYGMPLAALGANITWEFMFAFIHRGGGVQEVVNVVWFGLDVLILYTVLRFGRREFPDLSAPVFYATVVLAIVVAGVFVALVSAEFDNWAGVYAAFGQNFMMSVLFIAMLYRRRSTRGQSIGIAIAKMVGTACASAQFFFYGPAEFQNAVLYALYLGCFAFDALYLACLYAVERGAWLSRPVENAAQ
jgi:hypothetical protein